MEIEKNGIVSLIKKDSAPTRCNRAGAGGAGNPVVLVDPDGRSIKDPPGVFRISAEYGLTSGTIGISAKILESLGFGGTITIPGAASLSMTFYVDIDTETGEVNVGATHTQTTSNGGYDVNIGPFNYGQNETKTTERNINVEIDEFGIRTGITKVQENEFTPSENGGFSIINTTERNGQTSSTIDVVEVEAGTSLMGVKGNVGFSFLEKPISTSTGTAKAVTNSVESFFNF